MTSRIEEAINVLKMNDRGDYTVPTNRLYPYQWNWDSGFTALGLWHLDKNRAWLELASLLNAQWKDGMVPHIVFRQNDPDYFPGPGVWQTKTSPSTSGHSQPPVLASIVWEMVQMGGLDDINKAREIFPDLLSYHRWFCEARDPKKSGVIGIIHPWESGRDNCPDWDIGLAGVDVPNNIGEYIRRDTVHVDSDQRPTGYQYDRFLTIVNFGRKVGWNHEIIYNDGPFLMADPGVQFIFLRATKDLLEMARYLGQDSTLHEIEDWVERFEAGSEWLWNEKVGGYCARDLRTGKFSNGLTNASMLSFYAGVGSVEQQNKSIDNCRRIMKACKFAMPSWDPQHPGFESHRYWRGPVWAIMNYMIARGLSDAEFEDLAFRVTSDTKSLIEENGMAEYFDPLAGKGLGGMNFSWTAAIYLDLCRDSLTKDSRGVVTRARAHGFN